MSVKIGITCGHDSERVVRGWPLAYTNHHLVERLRSAGALPILIPALENAAEQCQEYIRLLDGIVVSGEVLAVERHLLDDFEEKDNLLERSNPLRYQSERALIRAALQSNIPLLGICRGFQVLNVEAGGTVSKPDMYKNNGVKHMQGDIAPNLPVHEISIVEGSKLKRLLNTDKIFVNSFHRQAISKVADGFKVSAVAPDGCIEAIEAIDDRWIMGMQFHPEMLCDNIWTSFFNGFLVEVRKRKKRSAL